MPWTLEGDAPAQVLGCGGFGLLVLPDDVEALKACKTPAEIQNALFAVASRARDARAVRDQLREALKADGQPTQNHLAQIWGLLHPPAGRAPEEDRDDGQ